MDDKGLGTERSEERRRKTEEKIIRKRLDDILSDFGDCA